MPVVVADAALDVVVVEALLGEVVTAVSVGEVDVTKMVVAGRTAPLLVVGCCVITDVTTAAAGGVVVGVTGATAGGGADDVEVGVADELEIDDGVDDGVDEIEGVAGCMVVVEDGIEVEVKKVEVCVTTAVEVTAKTVTC